MDQMFKDDATDGSTSFVPGQSMHANEEDAEDPLEDPDDVRTPVSRNSRKRGSSTNTNVGIL